MRYPMSVEVECEECGKTQEFDPMEIRFGLYDLNIVLEKAGWTIDGIDLCPDCRVTRFHFKEE